MAVKLKNAPRPKDQAADYRFVVNEATGRSFKAKHELRSSGAGRPILVVTISPVDEEGRALLNEGGLPDVASHSHEFTEVELSGPFDIEARVASILATAIAAKEIDLSGRAAIRQLSEKWTGTAALKLEVLAEEVVASPVVEGKPSK